MKIGYRKELDGVRAIAALMIIFFHFCQSFEGSNIVFLSLKKIATFGQTGVSLFFVLSGFLITRILLSTKSSPNYFFNFYVRRSLRIFPLYYFFLFISYFVIPLLYKTPIPDFGLQIYYWTYLQDFALTFNWESNGPGHFWSLAVEEHFYLFWPLVIYFFNSKKIVTAIVSIFILAFLVRILLAKLGLNTFYFTFCRMDDLAIGALLAILELKKLLEPKYSGKYGLLFILMIIPTISLWLLFSNTGSSILTLKFVLISLCYFCLIGYILTIKDQHIFKKILRLRFFLFTGKISYGLYVYHPLCFWLFDYYFKPKSILLTSVACLSLCYIVATASYYLLEIRFLKFKHYFNYGTVPKKSVVNTVT